MAPPLLSSVVRPFDHANLNIMNQEDQKNGKMSAFALWVPIACGVGVAVGTGIATTTGQMGTPMGIGICLGVPVGVVLAATIAPLWRRKQS